MKRIILILAALFSVAVLSSSIFVNRSKEERSLKALWAEYQEASEQQLSGWSGGFFRPLSYGFISVSPYAYREVKDARTLYWIDVFPEESSTIEEAFYVTQEGRFTSPAAEIESLYAPHYRANDSSPAAFVAVN